MYKVIIVDDERKICNLILELGDWSDYGMEVVDVCHDGEEGLKSMQKHRPDLVLTDVRMPVYDGLELIKRASEMGISSAFVIISGYKYFEYAYSAFKYGVIDYLLKPIEKEQLNEVLKKVADLLEAKRYAARAESELKRLNENMELNHRKQMFEDLFDDRDFPVRREELRKRYQKEFSGDAWQVFLIKTNRNLQDTSNALLVQKIHEVGKRIFQEEGKICMESIHQGIGGILNFDSGKEEQMGNRLKTLFLDIRSVAELFGNAQVTIGVGSVVYSLAELPRSAREARQAEMAKVSVGANRLIDWSSLNFACVTTEMLLTERKEREFEMLLEGMNTDGMKNWCSSLIQNPERGRIIRPEVLFQVGQRILDMVEVYGRKHEAEKGYETFRVNLQSELQDAGGIGDFFQSLEQGLVGYMEILKDALRSREKLPIRLAKSYINEHFHEPITLEETAEKVGLSPAYFSTNFKKFEKRTFTDYLTSVRMEAAKNLLSTTRQTNYEIAVSVGYTDDKYFCKVFKKEVGIRPGEYRKLYFRG